MISICDGWEFSMTDAESFAVGHGDGEKIRIPHNIGKLPLHGTSPECYAGVFGYRRRIYFPEKYKGKRIFIEFEGAAHISKLYVNGVFVSEHRCGYTAFRVDITPYVKPGEENLIGVVLDTREDASIPPFGAAIDYLTYGGIYRPVWIDVKEETYISDVFVRSSGGGVDISVSVEGEFDRARERVTFDILDNGTVVCSGEGTECRADIPDAKLWSTDKPNLYTLSVKLYSNDMILDEKNVTFGVREAVFRADGFYLNGEKTFLFGLNRHQSYPYIGYAATESLQREDARILKYELGCNAVRTSHYPQSRYFLDECDKIGLLVFTEIPGWQHIGDEKWKKQAVENTREMVKQNRNHPSVILWGVRINESLDDSEFYEETNRVAHELDLSRQTGGVRYIEQSELLEDVYTFNDFSHEGHGAGALKKRRVTPDRTKGYLISECNGHMFPTKPFDTWKRRQEQALRHARVQNEAMRSGDIAGCFGWCMFDYQTHGDFGSGDRICYHGVCDMFRNPKVAAFLYASQKEGEGFLELGSPMDIGDYNAGRVGTVYAFTNAESVRLYKNGEFIREFSPDESGGLIHPPIRIDDTVGELLEKKENYSKRKSKLIGKCLSATAEYGLANLPMREKLRFFVTRWIYGLSFEDGVRLYNRYIGNWGGASIEWRFDAVTNGKVVKSVTRSPCTDYRFEVKVTKTALTEGATYDMALVRVRIVDKYGCLAPYVQIPVHFTLSGPLALVGGEVGTAEGGALGKYVRTVSESGKAKLTVSADGMEDVSVEFTVNEERTEKTL